MLAHDAAVRLQRTTVTAAAATDPDWAVHTARNGSALPGDVVRRPGDPASGDPAVDEAADGVAASLQMYAEVYGRDSYDGAGATVVATVHYQRNYDNAFWNGAQLVFGDGDGEIFDRFTKPVDVLGHEFTHAVTEHTAGLVYAVSPVRSTSRSPTSSLPVSSSACSASRRRGRLADRSRAVPAHHQGPGIARPGPSRHGLRRPGLRP